MNKITFDTIHLDSTDIEYIKDLKQFKESNHIISIKDSVKYDEKTKQFHYIFHTNHKLYNKDCNEAIEITIVSIFLPHNIPPTLVDCQEMAKCHFFHTEAILSERSKNQQIKCFTDIFLFPEDSNIELRGETVFKGSNKWLEPYLKPRP